jgi:hypothetical protein
VPPRTSPKYGMEFTGIRELTAQLGRNGEVWQRVQAAGRRGMIENTEDLLGRSMRDAPVDEGTLRATGTATVYVNGKAVSRSGFREVGGAPEAPEMVSGLLEGGLGDAIVGEASFNTPYALAQHERLDYYHPKGGKAKYLEDNLKQQAGRYQGNLEGHLRGALR